MAQNSRKAKQSSKASQKVKMPKVTAKMIDTWCKQGEGQTLEFKRDDSLSSSDIVAFANGNGGIALLGVDEFSDKGVNKGKVVGLNKKFSDVRHVIVSRCSACHPKIVPRFQRVQHPSGVVAVVYIEKAGAVTCTSDGAYKQRHDVTVQALTPDQLKLIFLEQESETFLNRFRKASDGVLEKLEDLGSFLGDEISTLSGTVDRVAQVADDIGEKIDAVEDMTQTMRENIEEVGQLTAEVSSKVEEVGAMSESASSESSAIAEQLGQLGRMVSHMNDDPCRFDPRMMDFSNDFEQLSQEHYSLEETVREFEQQIDSKLQELSDENNALAEGLGLIEAFRGESVRNADVIALRKELKEIRDKLNDLTKRFPNRVTSNTHKNPRTRKSG